MKCFHFPGAGGQRQYGSSTSARLISVRSRGTVGIESRRSQGYGPDSSPAVWGPPEGLRAFSFSELRAATRGFSRALMIGEGGFGCVYRGVVRGSGDGAAAAVDVAVKQMSRSGLQGHKEWITEVNILGVVKHPNLVKLVGYCAEDDERGIQRLLVYEFMPNKSLEDHLLARISSNLSWTLRLKIACDAARGLAYLHEEMNFQLIFRDFKTSNVLLDEDFNAKLSDFGFARHGPAMGVGHISTSDASIPFCFKQPKSLLFNNSVHSTVNRQRLVQTTVGCTRSRYKQPKPLLHASRGRTGTSCLFLAGKAMTRKDHQRLISLASSSFTSFIYHVVRFPHDGDGVFS